MAPGPRASPAGATHRRGMLAALGVAALSLPGLNGAEAAPKADDQSTPSPGAPSADEIRAFLTQQLTYWNAGQRQEMTDLYRRYARDQLTIEFVGQPIGDGWAAYNKMWDDYGGKVRTDVVQILVNGHEGACHFSNVRKATGVANQSIEIYNFGEGRLHIRYFHP